MAWDEDTERWPRRRGRRWPDFDFEHMNRIFDEMFREAFETMPKELYREERLPDGGVVRRMGPFVYGYSMTLGPDGRPIIREFGNMKPSSRTTRSGAPRPSLDLKQERQPLVDVTSDNGKIHVTAELPGVDKKDIRLNCSEKVLTISVNSDERKYYKEVDLPAEVDPQIGRASYRNGVLAVTLTKIGKQGGETIRIE